MEIIKGEAINLNDEEICYNNTIFIDCIINYFYGDGGKAINCQFENCTFEQRICGNFRPNFMTECNIKNCLFEGNMIKSAHVINGDRIEYGETSHDVIDAINSKKFEKGKFTSLANSIRFLDEEGYEGVRGGLSIIFDAKQYPELKDYIVNGSDKGYFNFRLLKSPSVESDDIYYYFDGQIKELPENYSNIDENEVVDEDYNDITKEEIHKLNEDAKECYLQTVKILNETIGKDLEWNLTFDGYQIDSENFVSVWAYDSETNVIYQKCQMAYPT